MHLKKFEVATFKGWGDAFTRNSHLRETVFDLWPWGQGHMKCCPVPSTPCDLCSYKVWRCYILQFRRRCIYKKIQNLTFWPWGSRSHKMLPSTLNTMWPTQLQSLKLLHLTVKEKMHLQENTLFDLGFKVTWNVAGYPLLHVTYAGIKFEVATSKGLGGDTFTRNLIDGRMDTWTYGWMTDRLWFEINIRFFF